MEGSGSSDEAGDALGVFPAKSPDVVARVMESHRLDPDTVMLFPGGGEAPLGVALGLCRGG
jgi:sulfite reductase alpha subunit-like flavoprotein